MPEPKFEDMLDEGVEIDASESANLICRADRARTGAAYWQGKAEGLELLVAHLRADRDSEIRRLTEGHELVLRQMAVENETTIGYLKDRLNRLEVRTNQRDVKENG